MTDKKTNLQSRRQSLQREIEQDSYSFDIDYTVDKEQNSNDNKNEAYKIIYILKKKLGISTKTIILRDNLEDLLESNYFHYRPSIISSNFKEYEQVPIILTSKTDDSVLIAFSNGSYFNVYDPKSDSWITTSRDKFINDHAGPTYEVFPVFPTDLTSLSKLFIFIFPAIKKDLFIAAILSLIITLLALTSPIITSHVVGDVVPSGNIPWIISTFIVSIMLALYTSTTTWLQSYYLLRLNQKLNLRFQVSLYKRILSFPVAFVDSFSVGDLSSRATAINSVIQSLSSTTLSTLISGFSLIGYAGLMIYYDANLSIPSFIFIFISGVVQFLLIRRQVKFEKSVIEGQANLYDSSIQTLSAITQIRSTASEPFVLLSWYQRLLSITGFEFKSSRLGDWNSAVSDFLGTFGKSIIYAVLISRLINARSLQEVGVTTSSFIVFSIAYSSFSRRFLQVVSLFNDLLGTTLVQWQRALPLIKQSGEEGMVAGKERVDIKGDIQFKNVKFSYPNSNKLILEDSTFDIKAGKFNVLFGPSGCGKSTVLSILLGFYYPQYGNIFVDGIDFNELDINYYRRQLGTILQKPSLPAGSIKDSLTCGIPVKDELIWDVLKKVNIAKEIESLPMKLETVLSEGASNISGGQRQRLCIARALLNSPKILLEDEATSALDNLSQQVIINSLREMGITRIVVAHRVSAVKECDHMIILDANGKVDCQGSYDYCLDNSDYLKSILEN